MKTAKLVLSWSLLVGSLIGTALSATEVIGKEEPKLVLLLSWFALVFAALDGVLIAQKD